MAFAYVQQIAANNTATGTSLASVAAATGAGNHLFIHLRWETADTTVTITDSAGNTFTALTASKSGQGAHSQWFYCLNALGSASNVFTVTWAAAQAYRSLRVLEFSSTSPVYEQLVSTVQATGATSITSSAFNTGAAGLVLVGLSAYNSETSTNFGANYTSLASAFAYSKEAYRITTGALSGETITYTGSTTSTRAMDVLTLTEGSGGATNTPVNPGAGALTITGNAPAISQPLAVNPGAASLGITGYAPSIAQPQTSSPGPASLAISGYAPSIVQPLSVAPASGTLALTGYAPTVSQIISVSLSPSPASVAMTGYAPTIRQAVNVIPTLSLATIMRANSISTQAGTISARKDISGSAMASVLTLSTIMRAQSTIRTAAIRTDPINLTVSLS